MNLDDEYSSKAAQQSRERSGRPIARERQRRQSAAQKRRVLSQAEAIGVTPLDAEQLSDGVAQLASAWGLRRKQ